MQYIPEQVVDQIESLKSEGKFNDALKMVNHILIKNPDNEDALMQVADIEYRKWEIEKASKPIDYLLSKKGNTDPMSLYIKGVLEMEKNNWLEAKQYLKEAIKLTNFENHEIIRCYGLCEYWYGNREKGLNFIEDAFSLNKYDAEIIYNLIEIYLLEYNYKKAKAMIKYYFWHHKKLLTFDKEIKYYDQKVGLFEEFVKDYH